MKSSMQIFEQVRRRELTSEEAAELLCPTPWYATERARLVSDILLLVGWIMSLFLFCVAFAECTPPIPAPAVDPADVTVPDGALRDAAGDTRCERVCMHYLELPCPEGLQTSCVEGCERAAVSPASNFDPDCALAATSKPAIRICGVRCGLP